jgi:hypothetical protein
MTCYPAADWSCYPNASALDPDVKAAAELLGWSSLNALIAYQVPGDCPVTVRPCSPRSVPRTWYEAAIATGGYSPYGGGFTPYIGAGGQWLNACGCITRDCECLGTKQVVLPGPISTIASVTIDGATLDPSAYRVDNGIYLVRTDGNAWPITQDLTKDPTQTDTFAVTYTKGFAPNPLLALAAGRLAGEFAKTCLGQSCALPSNVVAVTRQGVTQEFQQNPFDQGTTGMPDVDAIVHIFNPYGLKTPPVVMSPDLPRGRTQTL